MCDAIQAALFRPDNHGNDPCGRRSQLAEDYSALLPSLRFCASYSECGPPPYLNTVLVPLQGHLPIVVHTENLPERLTYRCVG